MIELLITTVIGTLVAAMFWQPQFDRDYRPEPPRRHMLPVLEQEVLQRTLELHPDVREKIQNCPFAKDERETAFLPLYGIALGSYGVVRCRLLNMRRCYVDAKDVEHFTECAAFKEAILYQ